MATPHEETWTSDDGVVWCDDAVIGRFDGDLDTRTDRSDLAAAAPAMARLLLELQWRGGDACCPSCDRYQRTGHASDCDLVAVLRAAGVMP